MAFKLTKTESEKRDEMVACLEIKSSRVSSAIEAYNAAMAEHIAGVTKAYEEYNETLTEAQQFVEEVAERLQCEYDDKSEKWQEGDRGREAADLISDWQNIDLSEPEYSEPEEMEIPDFDHRDNLEALQDGM